MTFVLLSGYLQGTEIHDSVYLGQEPPGNRPVLFLPEIVSTAEANIHSSLSVTRDGREIYFSRLVNRDTSALYESRFIDGRWSEPVIISDVSEAAWSQALSMDEQRLYVGTSDRNGGEIRVIERTRTGWSTPATLGPVINFQKRQDGPCETEDGTIYFTSMFGNENGLFRSRVLNGEYTEPERITTGHRGRPADGYAYVSPDESYMLFMSWRPGGYGMWDLYAMFRTPDGEWSRAVNLGPKINSSASESFPSISPDGQYLFFNSNRKSVLTQTVPGHFYGNIYWVNASVIEQFRPGEIE